MIDFFQERERNPSGLIRPFMLVYKTKISFGITTEFIVG